MSETTKPKEQWNRLSAENFVKALQGETVKAKDGTEVSFLGRGSFGAVAIIVKEVIVEDPIKLEKENRYPYPIQISSGDFQKNFWISGGDFQKNFWISDGDFQEGFRVSGGEFQKSFRIYGGDFQSDFNIYGGNFQSDFRISGGGFQSDFRISGGDFQGGFGITRGNFQGSFGITRGSFQSDFEIYGGNFQSGFEIYGGNFQSSFGIYGGNFQSSFGIIRGSFQSDFEIYGGNFQSNFLVSNGNFQGDFRISNGDFQSDFLVSNGNFQGDFRISDGNFQGVFRISGGNFKTIDIENIKGYFNIIVLRTAIHYVVRIQNTYINVLGLTGSLHDEGRLYLKDITLNSLVIQGFNNESLIFTDGVTIKKTTKKVEGENQDDKMKKVWKTVVEDRPPVMVLESSDLGNATFFDTDFKTFKKISISSCRFTDIKTIGGHFPLASGKKQVVTDDNDNQDPVTLEETYNQLCLAMKNSGNRTWEMRYYAEYMEWHRKRLKKEGKERFTRFTLWLNKYTNSYNRNWFKAALLTMLLTFIGYMGYYLSIWGWDFRLSYLSWPSFFYHCGNYMQFMLPTHKFSFIENIELGSASVFIDAVSRIFIGYMIYQTISAFRRFGRR